MFVFVPSHLPHPTTTPNKEKSCKCHKSRDFFSCLFMDASQMSVIVSGVDQALTICWLDDWWAGDEAGKVVWWLVVKIIVGLGKGGWNQCHRLQRQSESGFQVYLKDTPPSPRQQNLYSCDSFLSQHNVMKIKCEVERPWRGKKNSLEHGQAERLGRRLCSSMKVTWQRPGQTCSGGACRVEERRCRELLGHYCVGFEDSSNPKFTSYGVTLGKPPDCSEPQLPYK